MDNDFEVILEYNNDGRVCNYRTGGEGTRVKVPPDEWERFNMLAGRQHQVVDGVVVFNGNLEPCEPDKTVAELEQELAATDYKALKYAEGEYTEEEYEPIKKRRRELRNKINAGRGDGIAVS